MLIDVDVDSEQLTVICRQTESTVSSKPLLMQSTLPPSLPLNALLSNIVTCIDFSRANDKVSHQLLTNIIVHAYAAK